MAPTLIIIIYIFLPFSFLAGPLAHSGLTIPNAQTDPRSSLMKGLQHNTHRIYHGKQQMFQSFCAWYHLTAFPASEDMLMVCTTYMDEYLQRHYTTVYHYMVAIHVADITPGLPNPLQNHPHLQQFFQVQFAMATTTAPAGLWPTRHHHRVPSWQARLLHQLHIPKDSVLWAALTLCHYSLIHSSEACATQTSRSQGTPVHPSVACPPPLLCRVTLHYVCIMLLGSKTNPFHLGCPSLSSACTGSSSVQSMQNLVHHPRAPQADTDPPRCTLPADSWQSPGLFNIS